MVDVILCFWRVLDSPCGGSADALVDLECLCQVYGGFTGLAVLKTGPAEGLE